MKNRILMAILPVLVCFTLLPRSASGQSRAGRMLSQLHDRGRLQRTSPSAPALEIQALVGSRSSAIVTGSFNTGVGAGALTLNSGGFQYRSWRCSVVAQQHRHENTAVGTDALVTTC